MPAMQFDDSRQQSRIAECADYRGLNMRCSAKSAYFVVWYTNRMASDSDRVLIAQIRQGDGQAWQQLIDRYEGRLLAFAERRLRDRAASEDVVQETFVGFLNSLPNFDDRRELQTYLFTIAAHKVTDQLRRTGRRPWHATGGDDGEEVLQNQFDSEQKAASSQARSGERKELESEAISRC